MIHPNSRAAYDRHDKQKRSDAVIKAMQLIGKPATDREILASMVFVTGVKTDDMNYVRPTITHLVDAGVIVECENVECHESHRMVRRTRIAPPKGDLF